MLWAKRKPSQEYSLCQKDMEMDFLEFLRCWLGLWPIVAQGEFAAR